MIFQQKPSPLKENSLHKMDKTVWKPKRRKGGQRKWGKTGVSWLWQPPQPDCGSHHGPWQAPKLGRGGFCHLCPLILECCVLGLHFGPWCFALDSSYWANWASLSSSHDFIWSQLHAFLLTLGSLNLKICNQNSYKSKASVIGEIWA